MARVEGVLLVINLLRETIALGDATADVAVNNAARAIIGARRFRVPVVHVVVPLFAGGPDPAVPVPLTSRPPLDPRLGPTGMAGTEFDPRVAPTPLETVLHGRNGVSAFAETGLEDYLRDEGAERVWVAGFPTETSVDGTVRDAVSRGLAVEVLQDCCAGLSRLAHAGTMGAFAGLVQSGAPVVLVALEEFYDGRRLSPEAAGSALRGRSRPSADYAQEGVRRPYVPPPSRPSPGVSPLG